MESVAKLKIFAGREAKKWRYKVDFHVFLQRIRKTFGELILL